MGDNEDMTTESRPEDSTGELDALEVALEEADPADAPDSADSLADKLNDLLDRTAAEPRVEDAP
jgi:hypothetical protein